MRFPNRYILSAVLLLALAGSAYGQVPLFGSSGPQVRDVIQGRLGSCFFHAAMAALVVYKPALVADMIKPGLLPGTYKVTFPDGAVETAYSGDITYARDQKYDVSKALWVTVLFRAYGQRVLRDALRQAVQKTSAPIYAKQALLAVLNSTDLPVLAYDRTIRMEISQEGNIDALRLKSKLRSQLQPLPLSDSMKESFLALLDSADVFSGIAETVKQNGEIFGAYRAVGNGGVPQHVLSAFLGIRSSLLITSSPNLRKALGAQVPAVAGTFLPPDKLPPGAERWYADRHAYTVLAFDAAADTVSLRNPWATDPPPDGIFTIPMSVFLQTFETLTVAVSIE